MGIENTIREEKSSKIFFADKAKKLVEVNNGILTEEAQGYFDCAEISRNKIEELELINEQN